MRTEQEELYFEDFDKGLGLLIGPGWVEPRSEKAQQQKISPSLTQPIVNPSVADQTHHYLFCELQAKNEIGPFDKSLCLYSFPESPKGLIGKESSASSIKS